MTDGDLVSFSFILGKNIILVVRSWRSEVISEELHLLEEQRLWVVLNGCMHVNGSKKT